MNSQKSYEFTEILRIHRIPVNSQTSHESADPLAMVKATNPHCLTQAHGEHVSLEDLIILANPPSGAHVPRSGAEGF